MSAAVLDIALVLVLAWQFMVGWRRGFLGTVLTMAGTLSGAFVALAALPLLPIPPPPGPEAQQSVTDLAVRVIVPVFVIALFLALGHRAGVALTGWVRDEEDREAPPLLSCVIGAALAVTVTCALAWSIGVALRGAATTPLANTVSRSTVLRSIDVVMPSWTLNAFLPLRHALDEQGFPQVFEGIGYEHIRDVDSPSTGILGSAQVQAAAGSVVRVHSRSSACGGGQEGSGWVVGDDMVVTNAHVVAGSDSVFVSTPRGETLLGGVTWYDERRDIAVLLVDGLAAPPLTTGMPLQRGDQGVVAGYPYDGPLDLEPVRVREVVTAQGLDIYGNPGVERKLYALRGTVLPGNSGGPLLNESGEVVGLVFARSATDETTGYALTMSEVRPVIEAAEQRTRPADTGACLN